MWAYTDSFSKTNQKPATAGSFDLFSHLEFWKENNNLDRKGEKSLDF